MTDRGDHAGRSGGRRGADPPDREPVDGGDPASCSQLGGSLRSHAASLADAREALYAGLQRMSREPNGLGAAGRAHDDLRLLEATAERLDRAGAALQQYAQELAEVMVSARALASEAQAAGLRLDGWQVVEPWGVVSLDDAAGRQDAVHQLQRRSERLQSALGRSRAALQRAMADGGGVLARAAAAARGSLGR